MGPNSESFAVYSQASHVTSLGFHVNYANCPACLYGCPNTCVYAVKLFMFCKL